MKLICLLFIALNFSLFAQLKRIIITTDEKVSYESEAQTYFDALSISLSTIQEVRVNTFVKMVKDSLSITSLSDKFDVMYLLANETSESGLKNIVKRSHDAEIGAANVTFTTWEGFLGDGIGGYINTDYNPSTQGVNFTLNDASLGVYNRTDLVAPGTERVMGNYYSGEHFYFSATGPYSQIGGLSNSSSETDFMGLWVFSKTSAATMNVYLDGTDVGLGEGGATSSLYNARIILLAARLDNDGGPYEAAPVQLAFAFCGSSLDATEARKLNNCIEWYMDQLGTGVQ